MKKHYNYSINEIKEKIRCPQLGSNDYGEWGSLPLWTRFVIDDLISTVDFYKQRCVLLNEELKDLRENQQRMGSKRYKQGWNDAINKILDIVDESYQ